MVLRTIDLFGVGRAMFASNFPVDRLVASFDTIYAGFKAIVRDFPLTDRRRLFHDNAVRLYRLLPPRPSAPAGDARQGSGA